MSTASATEEEFKRDSAAAIGNVNQIVSPAVFAVICGLNMREDVRRVMSGNRI